MKPVALLSSLLCILSSGASIARERPQLDAFYDSGRSLAVGRQLSPRAQALVREGVIAHQEPRLGVPTFFWAPRVETAGSLRAAGLTVEQAARRYLYNFADLYRIAPITMAEATLEKLHDTGRGGVIATFRAEVAGVPVFRDSLQVLMTRELQLVALTGYLSPHVGAAARTSLSFPLDRKTALASAYADLTGVAVSPQAVVEGAALGKGYTALTFGVGLDDKAPRLLQPARARKVLFPLVDKLEPAYYVELNVGDTEPDFYAYVLSATDGRILFRHNLTAEATYRVFADNSGDFAPYDGPQGNDASPHPTGTPNNYQAPFVAPQLVSLNALPQKYFSKSATDPWLPAGATNLTGNNVDAYADIAAPNGYSAGTDLRAPATGANVFDYAYNPLGAPDTSAQRQAAITQLFYTVNWHHVGSPGTELEFAL